MMDRNEIIQSLRLLVLTGGLSGTEFPQELLDELDRAENGDETVDVENLAQRFADAAPKSQSADLSNISFNEGKVAEGRRFKISVPDGWTVLKDYTERLFEQVRPFVIVAGEAGPDDDISLRDRVIYSSLAGDKEVSDTEKEVGTDDMQWALRYYSCYDRSDNNLGSLKAVMVWDTEVECVNTKCFVTQQKRIDDGDNSFGLEFDVYPYAFDHMDSLRFVFSGNVDVEKAKELVIEMAKTIELDKPVVSSCMETLDKALHEKISADDFVTMVNSLAKPYIALRQMIFDAAQYKYASLAEEFDSEASTVAGAQGIADLCNHAVPKLKMLLDAYEAQASSGARDDDLRKDLEAIEGFTDNVFPTTDIFDDDTAKVIEKKNIFAPSNELVDLKKRLGGFLGHELTGENGPDGQESSDESVASQPESDGSEPLALCADDDSFNEWPHRTKGDYENWFDPILYNSPEPAYAGFNRHIEGMAVCWLLASDHLFFKDDDIVWDEASGKHVNKSGRWNADKVDSVPTAMAKMQMIGSGITELLNEMENDEGLRVPRKMISPALYRAIRDGDLTGITLMNLQAVYSSLIIDQTEPHAYRVLHDPRLAMGIPCFYKLVARLIWDIRHYNGVPWGFKVAFVAARNFDADGVIDDMERAVAGSTTEAEHLEEVGEERPEVTLPSDDMVADASVPFASGYGDTDDMQADEDFFESFLVLCGRNFPKDIPIEGTHHLSRIPRIEHIKVGDKLVLASDWKSKWYDPCAIEVFSDRGETLGYLSIQQGLIGGLREHACLLPYITATVGSVTPLSKRRKNAKYALLDVHMELDEGVRQALGAGDGARYQEIVRGVKELLSQPREERVTISKGDLKRADLIGTINGFDDDNFTDSGSLINSLEDHGAPETLSQTEPRSTDTKQERANETSATKPILQQDGTPSTPTAKKPLMERYNVHDGTKLFDCLDYKTLSIIESFAKGKITGAKFVSASGSAVGCIQAHQQKAADRAADRALDDASGLQAVVRVAADHSYATAELLAILLDVIEEQVGLGTSAEDLRKMVNEAGEVLELLEGPLQIHEPTLGITVEAPYRASSVDLSGRLHDVDEMVRAVPESSNAQNKPPLTDEEIIEQLVVPYILKHEPVEAWEIGRDIDEAGTEARARALASRAFHLGYVSFFFKSINRPRYYGSPNAIWDESGHIRGHKEEGDAPKDYDILDENGQPLDDDRLISYVLAPFVEEYEPVKAPDVVRHFKGIEKPQRAKELLGAAWRSGLISRGDFDGQGGYWYFSNDAIFDDREERIVGRKSNPPTEESAPVAQAAHPSNASSGGCYIATAIYGSYDCPQVWTLRRYRDYELAQSIRGRLFIKLYYAISPKVVAVAGDAVWFHDLVKPRLDSMVARLQSRGYESTPYHDRDWS